MPSVRFCSTRFIFGIAFLISLSIFVVGLNVAFVVFVAAARALIDFPDLSAEEVAKKAMIIASDMCIHTNQEFMIEVIDATEKEEEK